MALRALSVAVDGLGVMRDREAAVAYVGEDVGVV